MRTLVFLLSFILFLVGCNEANPVAEVRQNNPSVDSAEQLNKLFNAERRNNFELATTYAQNGLDLSLKIGYQKGIADGFQNMGFVHYYRNDLPEALAAYLSSLQLMELLNDSAGIAECSYVIGKIHRSHGNYEKALEYSFHALEIQQALENPGGTSSVLNGIGNIYVLKKEYDSALYYYSQRMKLERMRGDSGGVASVLTDIGNVQTAKGNLQLGLTYHELAIAKLEEMNPDSSNWYLLKFKSGVLIDMAQCYMKLGWFNDAIAAARESLALTAFTNARKEKRNVYKMLAAIYKEMDRHDVESEFLEKYIALNDSLLNEEGIKQIANADAKYEAEKKEKELAVLGIEKANLALEVQQSEERTKLIFIGIGIFILLGGISGWMFYNRNRIRQQQEQFRAVIEGEENERKRIAMELHDGLGQLLSAARLNVSGLEENVAKEDDETLKTSLSLIDDACQEVRSISHNLMPAALIRLGLVAALRELAAKISQSGQVKVIFDHQDFTLKLSNNEEIGLYRIIQEVVNNALKYAAANTITIKIKNLGGEAFAEIRDDGIGMNMDQADSSTGIGWKNIRSRVQLLEGKLDIHSAPGKGTSVEIRINSLLQ